MIALIKKLLGMSKPSRESQIRAEIATLDRVAKYGGSSDEVARRRAALVEELTEFDSQCADCNGTRRVDGQPCRSCCPTDDGPDERKDQ